MRIRKKPLQRICLCALFAALICILSPIAIPIGPVPVSLSLIAVLLSALMLGVGGGVGAVAVYLLIGAVGLPVFGGGMGGFGVLLGPTGGYIWSYLPMTLLCGALYRRVLWSEKRVETGCVKGTVMGTVCALPGLLICYLLGTVQYMLVARVSAWAAIAICVLPFIGFDLVKLVLVAFVGVRLLRMNWLRRMIANCFGKNKERAEDTRKGVDGI